MKYLARCQGGNIEGQSDGRVIAFKGIPYAEPPVGNGRLKRSKQIKSWSTTIYAHNIRNAPIQRQLGNKKNKSSNGLNMGAVNFSEDCLYLNIWSPASNRTNLPVMIFIHGGGFCYCHGGAPYFDASKFVSQFPIIIVTLNYRLGVLGFLDARKFCSSKETTPDTNIGLHDQINAINWIKENIEAFGGSPEKMTLYGMSTGANSVACLISIPKISNIVRGAICQGAIGTLVNNSDESSQSAYKIMEELELSSLDINQLNRLDSNVILNSQLPLEINPFFSHFTLPWKPIIDDDILKAHPLESIKKGLNETSLLTGVAENDTRYGLMLNPEFQALQPDNMLDTIIKCLHLDKEKVQAIIDAYRQWTGNTYEMDPPEFWSLVTQDAYSNRTIHHLNEAHVHSGAPTYSYIFNLNHDLRIPGLDKMLGASHSLEPLFVFASWDRVGLMKRAKQNHDLYMSMEHQLQTLWYNFCIGKTEEYTSSDIFTEYTANNRKAFLIGSESKGLSGVLSKQKALLWDEVNLQV